MGISRLKDGRLVVAARTDMTGCTGDMFDWWFKFFSTTEHLKWWHPSEHKAHYGWDSHWKKGQNYIGATIYAEEGLGTKIAPIPAKIRFHAAEDFFSTERLMYAREQRWISTAVCGCIGFGQSITLDGKGDPIDGRMIHLIRDTGWGCVLRSRFILGETTNTDANPVADEIGLGLMQHAHCEFTSLSRLLPSLYYGENAATVEPPNYW
ncbi:hydrolase [Pantoea sp. LMR881]|nr:hydrolase [Pantoea sp. LMR881]MCZ4061505.1 hydrolase [Pantoea sp. LMR881]